VIDAVTRARVVRGACWGEEHRVTRQPDSAARLLTTTDAFSVEFRGYRVDVDHPIHRCPVR
jgi:hypothetical protein